MKTLKGKWIFLVLVILFFIVIMYIMKGRQLFTANASCIKPFHEFAYLPDETSRPVPEILPAPPWQVEATIPALENTTYNTLDIQIELARTKNGKQEIWLFKNPFDSGIGTIKREGSFVIYHPQTQTWEEVSAIIGGTNLVVRDIFVTSDGNVWGQIGTDQPHSTPTMSPVLARFNESTQRFEAATGGLEITIRLNSGLLSHLLEIVLDKQDIFWIFGPNDGIYRYDPQTQTTKRQTDLPNKEIDRLSTALASDGSIYFQDKSISEAEEFLFQFIPETGEIVTLDVLREPWETSSGMLVDRRGRLWLGAMGYMETDGSWHLLHRDAPNVWENRSEFLYWSPPTLLFESSNGLLWYTEYHDMERLGEGSAWYNPETGQGCLFTNIASYIVEDAENQLWIVADGKLYRYPLGQ